jgi:predicted RNA binding protein YcfA (HicA-like mRNA interferase family)
MARKIRQLIKDLESGFINRGGKGSHRNYVHSKGIDITISGKLGDDAKHYQEKEVEVKINSTPTYYVAL